MKSNRNATKTIQQTTWTDFQRTQQYIQNLEHNNMPKLSITWLEEICCQLGIQLILSIVLNRILVPWIQPISKYYILSDFLRTSLLLKHEVAQTSHTNHICLAQSIDLKLLCRVQNTINASTLFNNITIMNTITKLTRQYCISLNLL